MYDCENFTVCEIPLSILFFGTKSICSISFCVFALLRAQIEDEGLNAEDPVLEEDIPPEPEPEPEIGMLYSYSTSHMCITHLYTHMLYQPSILTALKKCCAVLHCLLRVSKACIITYH